MRPWRNTPRPLPPGPAKRSVNRVFVGRCGATGWLLKKTLRASEQRRPDVAAERDEFSKEIAAVNPNRLVFLDESGILTNMTRRSARAPIGERACGYAAVNWKRLTVLGALGLDGVVAMTTVTTGTTIPVFVDFLQTSLLPVLREHKPDALRVIDNRSIGQSVRPQESSGQGHHHGGGADPTLPAPLFPRRLAHRALLVKERPLCEPSRRETLRV